MRKNYPVFSSFAPLFLGIVFVAIKSQVAARAVCLSDALRQCGL
jgi:hypothetical protein